MKYFLTYLFAFCLGIGTSFAQEEGFYLELQSDTILAGNILQVSFIANNISGKFEAPDLDGLNVVNGPNTATSMSMVNGAVTQHASYSYGIYVEEVGEVFITPAYLVTEEGTLESEPASVIILPNPEGIIEQPPSQSGIYQFSFPNRTQNKKDKKKDIRSKKKKRKLKKI